MTDELEEEQQQIPDMVDTVEAMDYVKNPPQKKVVAFLQGRPCLAFGGAGRLFLLHFWSLRSRRC